MVMECILVDNKLLDASLEKATHFFIYGILPGVLGKWYSNVSESCKETTRKSKEKGSSNAVKRQSA